MEDPVVFSEATASSSSASGGGTSTTASGAGGGSVCSADLPSIEQAIFATSCAGNSCHNATDAAGDLDLVSPGVEGRLVDVAAATCKVLRVAPGKPEESFLYQKVADARPVCGDRMPVGAVLSAEQLGCLRDWIASLSVGCETCGTGACVDTMSDSSHCGACANSCKSGTSCKTGACLCDNGGLDCGGTCTLVDSDPKNCGGCGKACKTGEVCLAGGCSTQGCGALSECGGACVDPTNDPKNCGGCGKTCAPTETCSGATCICPGARNLMSDAKNCGVCGNVCAQGESCVSGKCVCGTATVSFSKAVQPILSAMCATTGCHVGGAPKAGLDLAAAKAYSGLFNVKAAQCNDGRLRVKPGAPADSYLIDKISNVDLCAGSKMPKNTDVSAADLQTIVNWICGGALND
ncbi:MAG: hypothetical protein FJ096_12285 [Deltaproteobacteria bacterium]|nr:hypothetical protein [Deltaproteobacteria bacterium]